MGVNGTLTRHPSSLAIDQQHQARGGGGLTTHQQSVSHLDRHGRMEQLGPAALRCTEHTKQTWVNNREARHEHDIIM